MPRRYGYHWPEDFHEDSNFIMSSGQLERFIRFKTACDYAGSSMISTQYHNAKSPLWFRCAHCGKPHYNTYDNFNSKHANWEFLCSLCDRGASPDIGYIRKVFALRGACLITTEYINQYQKLEFLCSKCGRVHSISWGSFLKGINPNLVCPLCSVIVSPTIDFIFKLFAERGALLLSTEYINAFTPLKFKCSQCGSVHYINWHNFSCGRNSNLLCSRCLTLFRINPNSRDFYIRNTEIGGLHWGNYGKLFFNVKAGSRGIAVSGPQVYSYHHLYSYESFENLRSCLTNGFPVFKIEHWNPGTKLFKLIHSEKWRSPDSWNSDEFINSYPDIYQLLKLPYHTYHGFRFHDLTKFLVTETFIRDIDKGTAKAHKAYWSNKGRIYLPVSSDTLAIKEERNAFFSLVRDELRQFIPEIDQYTGVGFNFSYYSRKRL